MKWKICANPKCGKPFDADDRGPAFALGWQAGHEPLYCSSECKAAIHNRRNYLKNREKRIEKAKANRAKRNARNDQKGNRKV